MRNELPRTRTPITLDQSAKLLIEEFKIEHGRLPTQNEAILFQSQLWLESGSGKSVFQFNVGNITASSRWDGDFWHPPWFDLKEIEALPEGVNKKKYLRLHALMLEGKAPKAFRAYENHRAAIKSYARLLKTTFPSIVSAADSGDVSAFAHAVRDSGYCPDCKPNETIPTFEIFSKQFRNSGIFSSLPNSLLNDGGGTGVTPLPKAVSEVSPSSPSAPVSSTLPLKPNPNIDAKCDLPTLKFGDYSLAVKVLQRALNVWGYPGERLLVGGRFDKTVQDRVTTFQVNRKLLADGIVGPVTWRELLE